MGVVIPVARAAQGAGLGAAAAIGGLLDPRGWWHQLAGGPGGEARANKLLDSKRLQRRAVVSCACMRQPCVRVPA